MAHYDLLMISDLRLPGGTTASMAEEIHAQSAAGFRAALLHVNSSLSVKVAGISPHLTRVIDQGLADLALPGDEIRATHAIIRHPRVAQEISGSFPGVTVEGVSLIANHPFVDGGGVAQYDPLAATKALTTCFGHVPTWRPIGPVVRESLTNQPAAKLADEDWVNIIDVKRWASDRSAGVRGVPVIGRHSRDHPSKWPTDATDILAAYPDTDDVMVRIMGGAEPARAVLGALPSRWVVEPFGARDPREFVANIDFFVYFHNAQWKEAFGRTVLEALASGAVAILPEQFSETFGDAAIYATPADVRGIVEELSANRDAYVWQSRHGSAFVSERYSYATHAKRLSSLVGRDVERSGVVRQSGLPLPGGRSTQYNRDRVLFVTSNGTGMGHLTRLLAMASRASDSVEPFFFSLSSAVPVVAQYGYGWEYCPSRDDLDVSPREWNPLFTERLADIIRRFRPRALAFDGTMPYEGIRSARRAFPDLVFVWSRRPMWQQGKRTEFLARSEWFDLVIEPGEFASAADKGPTVGRTDAVRVRPITLLDSGDALGREESRAALGIGPDEQAVLVTLGGGNHNDVTSDLDIVADVFAGRPGWKVYATQAPIARSSGPSRPGITTISVYPLARYLAAFDVSVAACGYNAYHESIMSGVPTIFVPKAKVLDDQFARARYAADVGVGVSVDTVNTQEIDKAVDRVLDPTEAALMRERCEKLYPGNGAAEAMALIENLLIQRQVPA